ncbi:hypothetical protein D3C81_2023830 [compost metagenome]
MLESEVINQPAPTSCIHVPILEAMLASHSQRKVRYFRGLHGDADDSVMLAPAFYKGREAGDALLPGRENIVQV